MRLIHALPAVPCRLLSALVIFTLTAPAADIQPPSASPQRPSSTPTIRVYSRETIVDVTVTDKDGNPVHGLTRDDFTIEENSKPQPIRGFQEFGMSGPAPTPKLPPLPPGIYTNYQTTPAAGPVNILFLDALHARRAETIVYSLKAISQYVQRMPDGTQVALFWLSDSGLHMIHGFTSDRTLLQQSVVLAAQRTDIGNQHALRPWEVMKITTDGFQQLAAYAAAVKGRKNLLWFVAGMPAMLDRDGGYEWIGSNDMTAVHHLMDTYEMLTAQQVAVYPVDPSGPHPIGMAQLKAEEVAQQSGGIALYNNNDVAGLIAKAVDHGSHFYTISYNTPGPRDDGHFHHLKVTVNKPDLTLTYRSGFNSEQPPSVKDSGTGNALLKAAMEGQAPPATQLLFDVKVAAGQPGQSISSMAVDKKHPAPKVTVPVNILYLLPQSQITFAEATDGTHSGSLEFDIAAYDDSRKLVGLASQTMKLPLTPDEYSQFIQTPFQFSQQLDLPPGPLTLRAGIVDSVSGKVGTIEIPINTSVRPTAPETAPPPCPPRCPLPKAAPAAAR